MYKDKLSLNQNDMTHNENSNIFRYIFLSVITFIYIYSLHVSFIPTFITNFKGISLILLALTVVLDNLYFKPNDLLPTKEIKLFYLWQVVLLVHVYLIELGIGVGSGSRIFKSISSMLIYMPITLYGFKNIFKNKEEFFNVLIIFSVVQSLVVFGGVLSPSFKTMINNNFNTVLMDYYNKNTEIGFDAFIAGGYATGIGCMTSKGSLKLSLGMVSCLYFILKGNKTPLYFILFAIITIASTAVARTGLLLACVGVAISVLYFGFKNFKRFLSAILIIVISLLVLVGAFYFFDLSDLTESTFKRLIGTFEKGVNETYLDQYFDGSTTVIPKINEKTFGGTGVTSGAAGNGVVINVDGGYIRTFFALGPIVAVLNYLVILLIMMFAIFRMKSTEDRVLGFIFFVFLCIGEFKEFFVYEGYYIYFIFLFFALAVESDNSKNLESENCD